MNRALLLATAIAIPFCALPARAWSDLPPAVDRELAGEAKKGLKTVEVKRGESGGTMYVAAILEYPESAGSDAGNQVLKLYSIAAGATSVVAKELYKDARVGFGTYEEPDKVFVDINGDGALDLVVSGGNGGNCWQCSQTMIYALKGSEATEIAAEPMTIKDVMGDAVPELLVGDTRWESYDDFSHAAAPGGTLVYKWTPGGYVFAGPDAKAYYAGEVKRMRDGLQEAIGWIKPDETPSDDFYLGTALSMYLAEVYSGNAEAGRAELTKMFGEHVASEEQRKHRAKILDDFLKGESATLLATPKPGQPLSDP